MNIVARMDGKCELSVFVYQIKQCALGIYFFPYNWCGSWDVFSKNWKVLMKIQSNGDNDRQYLPPSIWKAQRRRRNSTKTKSPLALASIFSLLFLFLLTFFFRLLLFLFVSLLYHHLPMAFTFSIAHSLICGCPMVFTMMFSMHRKKLWKDLCQKCFGTFRCDHMWCEQNRKIRRRSGKKSQR